MTWPPRKSFPPGLLEIEVAAELLGSGSQLRVPAYVGPERGRLLHPGDGKSEQGSK